MQSDLTLKLKQLGKNVNKKLEMIDYEKTETSSIFIVALFFITIYKSMVIHFESKM